MEVARSDRSTDRVKDKLTAPLELTQFMLMRVVNLTEGGLSGYSAPHSKRRLYMRFSKAV